MIIRLLADYTNRWGRNAVLRLRFRHAVMQHAKSVFFYDYESIRYSGRCPGLIRHEYGMLRRAIIVNVAYTTFNWIPLVSFSF